VEPFLRHAAVLCNNVPQHTEYLLKYLAHIVQYPGQLFNVAIVLKSIVEGVGKNTFLDFFMKLVLGKDLSYESANPVRDLFSRFSQGRKERLMIVINETNGKDTHAFSKQIKDMIMLTTYNHEEKGIRPIKMNNYARLIFTTNNDVPVKIEQHDRRFVVFEASNELVGNAEYFRNFAKYAADPNNALAVYEYLKSLDLTTIHLANDRPKTE
jgi:putative DNA primase/helicase